VCTTFQEEFGFNEKPDVAPISVGASLLAMNSSAMRFFSKYALSLISIASKLAPAVVCGV
jgi:hypothetical protein